MNPQEGWYPASEAAKVARFYFPDLLENKDVQQAIWSKGTRHLLPQLKRGLGDPGDIALLRMIYPQRFPEIQLAEDDCNYILRHCVKNFVRARKNELKYKNNGKFNFSVKSVMEQAFHVKIITAKEVLINSENFELRIVP